MQLSQTRHSLKNLSARPTVLTAGGLRCLGLVTALFLLSNIFTLSHAAETNQDTASVISKQNLSSPKRDNAELLKYPHAPGQLLVRFKRNANFTNAGSAQVERHIHKQVGSKTVKRFSQNQDLELVEFNTSASMLEMLEAFQQDPSVDYVEPNYFLHTFATPLDPSYTSQWNLNNIGQSGGTLDADINAPLAWDMTTGSSNTVVGVIDSGVDYTHPDLAANMWTNSREIPNNNIDDDNNGYIDDIFGVNTINESGDPFDDDGHGTHVAGILGARGNNGVGIAGINWQVEIIACKFLVAEDSGLTSDAVECLDYFLALKNRAIDPVNIVVTNNSWGGAGFSQALFDAIEAHQNAGILFVAAAGNDGEDIDLNPSYPASYELGNVISVAATDDDDQLSSFSNFGRFSVDVGAPGSGILSTVPTGSCPSCSPSGYAFFSGTSMATPHVAGLAALLHTQDPARNATTIRNLILSSGTTLNALNQTATSKRIRAADNNGVGALSCNNQILTRRTKPNNNRAIVLRDSALDLNVLNINCGNAAGNVSVSVTPANDSVTLLDNGVNADADSGDGVYSASYIPLGPSTLVFPGNDLLPVDIIYNYQTPVMTSFVFRTISSPTNLNLADDEFATISIPFSIPFGLVENGFTELFVSSNGVLSFDSNFEESLGLFAGLNLPLTSDSVPLAIAPFWDDLNPEAGGSVVWGIQGVAPNRQLIVEWRDVPHFESNANPLLAGSAGVVTFQVVFFENSSDVLFNYLDVDFEDPAYDDGASATIGTKVAPTGITQFSNNSASVSNNLALLWQVANVPPTANAGPNQVVQLQSQNVVLNGSNSRDADNVIVDYLWTQLSGTSVTINNANTAIANIDTPTSAETLRFNLTVTDGDGLSASDTVDIRINAPPNSNAGTPQTVGRNSFVTLNGSASSDSDGSISTYSWAQTAGTSVTLSNTAIASPTFTASGTAEDLRFELTVTDSDGVSDTAMVTITVSATAMTVPNPSTPPSSGGGSSGGGGSINLSVLLFLLLVVFYGRFSLKDLDNPQPIRLFRSRQH